MGMTDPIADMLTRIRNASRARHQKVAVPWSRVKENIVKVLIEEGYLKDKKSKSSRGRGRGASDPAQVRPGESADYSGMKRVSTPGPQGLRRRPGRDADPQRAWESTFCRRPKGSWSIGSPEGKGRRRAHLLGLVVVRRGVKCRVLESCP